MITHEYWLLLVLLLVLMKVGEYSRGETSYIPWDVYESVEYRTHDVWDSLIKSLWVLMTDIVILFGCSEYIVKEKMNKIKNEENELIKNHLIQKLEEGKKFYYIVNFLFGLLLMTEHNLFYKLIDLIPLGDGSPPW